ncbi:MAG: glycosyltransferase [Desulfovibrio sp.]|nr:MAG: glycosyltransferase [Desulfovibrio sp.]
MTVNVHHLITSLDTGGAEMALYRLLLAFQKQGMAVGGQVTSLRPVGPVGDLIRSLGIEVDDLGMRRSLPDPVALARLVSRLKASKPDILQTWMYHADLLGLMAARLAGITTTVWNIRCTKVDFSQYSRFTRLTVSACAKLSARPSAVIANSHAGKADHLELGYSPQRFLVIPNGVDLERFTPNEQARAEFRAEMGVDHDEVLVGMAARFDPMKGHHVFCKAASMARKEQSKLRFVLAGKGSTPDNAELMGWLKEEGLSTTGLKPDVRLLGRRDDMERVLAGMDVLCMASLFGEGFPNTVAEAMACGAPCVVSDVGDAARMVGDSGVVVDKGDEAALAGALAWFALAGPDARRERGRQARERAEQRFSLGRMASAYYDLYAQLHRNSDNAGQSVPPDPPEGP